MRYAFITIFLLAALQGFSQNNSFGLIKFSVPENWSEQIKTDHVSFTGSDPASTLVMEIRVHQPQPAAAKPDSSFKLAWKEYIGTSVPAFKKGFSESSLPIAYNPAFPAAVTEGSTAVYKQLLTVVIDQQMQVIEFIAASEKDIRLLKNFINEFTSSIDTIVKRKD